MSANRKQKLLPVLGAVALLLATHAFANEDHRQIAGPFNSPMEVTEKCLECHEDAAHDRSGAG